MTLEVLIADDDVMINMIHTKMVENIGFHAHPVSFLNGKELLDHILDHNRAGITYCVLLDINMPFMNGWDFLDALSQEEINARILVVIISSSVDAIDKEKAVGYPQVIDYLVKPINLNILEMLKKNDALKIFFNPA